MGEKYDFGIKSPERNRKRKSSLEVIMHIYKRSGKTNISFEIPRRGLLWGIKLNSPNPRTLSYKLGVFREVRECVESYFSE